MPRKKSKKQLRLEEKANFVPYITELDEDTWLYHYYGVAVKVSKIPRDFSNIDVNPFLKYLNFLDENQHLGKEPLSKDDSE